MVGKPPFLKESLYSENKSLIWGDFMVENSFSSELKPIGECILTDPIKYIVPEHQRDFSWDKEVEEFW